MIQTKTLRAGRFRATRDLRGSTLWAAEVRLVLAITLLAMSAPTAASSESIHGEGPFAANFVGYAEIDIPPLESAAGRSIGITNSAMTAMNAENALFLDNRTGRCLGTWEADPTAGTFEQRVHCTYTDDDGDQIFERAEFERQALDGPRVGTGQWLGGTGKYEGLSGVFEIRVRSLRSAREGLIQYVGTKQGHYRLPPLDE
jgi:hypothetical protein